MKGYRKLGRNSAHRKSMLRNLVTDLFREGRITTTEMRAKEAGRQAEKLITIAKKGDLHARRQALAYIKDDQADKAIPILEKLEKENPDTPIAAKAQKILKEIKK